MGIATNKLKETVIRVYGEVNARSVVDQMVKMGFKWRSEPMNEWVELIQKANKPVGVCIFVDKNCRMEFGMEWHYEGDPIHKRINIFEFAAIFNEHKAEMKAKKKLQRKKAVAKKLKAQQESGEWIQYHGTGKPVDDNIIVDVKFHGETRIYSRRSVGEWGWHIGNSTSSGAIAWYRLVLQERKISVEDMVGAVAKDLGKEVARIEHKDSFVETNPKRQYGIASIPLDMWSDLASAYGALGLYNGSLKYGKANFANTPVEASIYIAAAKRHLAAWAAGEEFDPADGVPNLGGVLANIAILLEARAAGMLIDDRLKMDGYLKEREVLKAIIPKLQDLYKGKSPKHYTIGDV